MPHQCFRFEAFSADNRGQKLAAVRRLGFRNSIIQFKRFSEKIFYLYCIFRDCSTKFLEALRLTARTRTKLEVSLCSPC